MINRHVNMIGKGSGKGFTEMGFFSRVPFKFIGMDNAIVIFYKVYFLQSLITPKKIV